MIKVRMYPAKNGDCFLISIGNERKKHILLDLGYGETYDKFLKQDLVQINGRNERINLMIVTHIDEDHILGAIKFITENNKSKIIEVDEIWHNSYRHLQSYKQKNDDLTEIEKNILNDEIAIGRSYVESVEKEGIEDTEISSNQGSTLGALLLKGKYNWNSSFNGQAVSVDNRMKVEIDDDLKIHIISPNNKKLDKLAKKWIKDLRRKKWDIEINENDLFDDAYEYMLLMDEEEDIEHSGISRELEIEADINLIESKAKKEVPLDKSEVNGSSIAFILEYNKKNLLFLGDAHSDIIFENLKKMNIDNFDLVKIPHHGSKKNMTGNLSNLLKSNTFLVSTDGKHHFHPHIEAISKVIFAHPEINKKLYFNYDTKLSRYLAKEELQQAFNYEIVISLQEEPLDVEI